MRGELTAAATRLSTAGAASDHVTVEVTSAPIRAHSQRRLRP